MNSNKKFFQKYVFEQNEYILEMFVKFVYLRSAMKITNTKLDGAYLAVFGIDITTHVDRV